MRMSQKQMVDDENDNRTEIEMKWREVSSGFIFGLSEMATLALHLYQHLDTSRI